MELNIESLTKHYGDLYALGDFTVCLRPGVYGLLGPNGAGKSTLMNLLTDTVKREAGSIRYNGKEILELGRGYRALVGYMPQQQGYYEEFTVGRFLYYMAALKGLSRSKGGNHRIFGGRWPVRLSPQKNGQPFRRHASTDSAGASPPGLAQGASSG